MEKIEINNKKTQFDIFDGAFACLIFVILQIFFTAIISVIPRSVLSGGFITFLNVVLELLFVLSSVLVAVVRKRNMFSATTLNKKINFPIVGLALAIAVISLLTFSGVTNGFMAMLESFGYTSVTGGGVDVSNFGKYLLAIITVCVVPAFCEELLFRGVVLNSFRGLNKWIGIILSGIFFMLMHGNPDQTIHQLLLGIILGYIAWETQNIWTTILIHFFNNFIAISISFISQFISSSSSVSEGTTASWTSIVSTIFVGILICAVGVWAIIMITKFIKKQSDKINSKQESLQKAEESQASDETIQETQEVQKPSRWQVIATVFGYGVFVCYFLYEWIKYLIIGFNL